MILTEPKKIVKDISARNKLLKEYAKFLKKASMKCLGEYDENYVYILTDYRFEVALTRVLLLIKDGQSLKEKYKLHYSLNTYNHCNLFLLDYCDYIISFNDLQERLSKLHPYFY